MELDANKEVIILGILSHESFRVIDKLAGILHELIDKWGEITFISTGKLILGDTE